MISVHRVSQIHLLADGRAASLATYGLTLTNGTGTITLTSTQIAAAGGLIIVKCNANAITIG